jgi:hypothetical protein
MTFSFVITASFDIRVFFAWFNSIRFQNFKLFIYKKQHLRRIFSLNSHKIMKIEGLE